MSIFCRGELPSSGMNKQSLGGPYTKQALLMTAPCKQNFSYEAGSIEDICNVFREGEKLLWETEQE